MIHPYVILNAAMTLDGKIATVTGESNISSKADLLRLHKLRREVDVVMVGLGTVLIDDPKLTVRLIKGKNPIRVVVDGQARVPLGAKVLDDSALTIVAVSKKAKREKLEKLRKAGANIIVTGKDQVNLRKLLEKLKIRGVRKILLEGGSTLNWWMLKEGLVDEVRVAVAPRIVGGARAKSLVGGSGFKETKDGVKFKLLKIKRVGADLLLVYKVVGGRSAKKTR